MLSKSTITQADRTGYKIAMTEWNWNGWWSHPGSGRPAKSIYRTQAFDSLFAKGVGAAGMLHAIMRRGDVIEIAAQSMLVGDKWDIHAIYADRNGLIPPYILPTGQVTMLYSRFHGHDLLGVELGNMAYYEQPYRMGSIGPAPRVAYLDILATRDANTLFLHAINRHFNQALSVQFDISDLDKQPATYGRLHILEGRLINEPAADEPLAPGWIRDTSFTIAGQIFQVHLPARSVTVAEVQLH